MNEWTQELADFLRFCELERRLAPLTCSAYERDVAACLAHLQGQGIPAMTNDLRNLRLSNLLDAARRELSYALVLLLLWAILVPASGVLRHQRQHSSKQSYAVLYQAGRSGRL